MTDGNPYKIGPYNKYINAIRQFNKSSANQGFKLIRITNHVPSILTGTPQGKPSALPSNICLPLRKNDGTKIDDDTWKSTDYLLDQEIFGLSETTAPKMTCVAVNTKTKNLPARAPMATRIPFSGIDTSSQIKNQPSLAFIIKFNQFMYFTGGDIEKAQELSMIPNSAQLNYDYMKLSHHGSLSASPLDFLTTLNPLYAVISSGSRSFSGSYLPRLDVLKRLTSLPRLETCFLTNKPKSAASIPNGNTELTAIETLMSSPKLTVAATYTNEIKSQPGHVVCLVNCDGSGKINTKSWTARNVSNANTSARPVRQRRATNFYSPYPTSRSSISTQLT